MINQRIIFCIENNISNIKPKFKKYITMQSSLDHLMKVAKDFYYISIGSNEISDGIKNSKRLKVSILQLIYMLIGSMILHLFAISNYFYSLLHTDFLPGHFRILVIGSALASIMILAIKIDMILAEIKSNLSPLKVFYFLINNLKTKHKLTDLNYNRLAILSRIVLTVLLEYGVPISLELAIVFCVLIAILSQKLIWIFLSINFVPCVLLSGVIFTSWMCINFILFAYYTMRFDQIHSSIKSIVSNGSFINKRREKQLINLFEEHKSVANQIHKLNSMLRRSAGVIAIELSTGRMMILYLLINYNNNFFVKLMLFNAFFIMLIFGFGLTYLFSRQIKSAHQSDKLIYSILCRFNMRLQFKFKVK